MSATPVSPSEHERRRIAYADFNTDREAAEALGILPNAFKQWRYAVGLPAHKPPRRLTRLPVEVVVARTVERYGADAVRRALEAMS